MATTKAIELGQFGSKLTVHNDNITLDGTVHGQYAGFDSDFTAKSTSDLSEGTNLYHTTARARSSISATGSLSYNSSTGIMSFTQGNTDTISEGSSNLYYTDERVDDRVGALVVGGNNITATYNDTAGTLTIDGQPGYADSDVGSYLSANGYGTSSSIIGTITASAPSTLDTLNELAAALGDDANFSTTVTNSIATKLPLAGGTMSGAIAMGTNNITGAGTVSGTGFTLTNSDLDIGGWNIDASLYSTNTNVYYTNAIHNFVGNTNFSAGIDVTGNVTATGTVDGRDVATDGAKLDGIEAGADVTDVTNVTAAGALMDTEVTNLAQVKAFDSTDYATAAQGTTADNALPKAGGTITGDVVFSGTNHSGVTWDTSEDEFLFAEGSRIDFGGGANIRRESDGILRITGATADDTYFNFSNNLIFYRGGSAAAQMMIAGSTQRFHAYGNITVGGTVDGRDVATDGTKLDGIESGATADQTAAQILTAVKTVDGSGSGLDADTVDGIQGSSFLRSDADDTTSGIIVFGPNSTWSKYLKIGGNANNSDANSGSIGVTNGNLHLDAANGAFATYLNFYDGTGGVAFGNGGGSGAVAWMGPDGDLWKGGADNTGSKYWHAGNDGSGSGLDADTVDGIQGSSFLRSDADDSYAGNLNVNNMVFKSNSNTQRNLKLQPVSSSNDVGISLFNGPGTWVMQLYGNSGNGGEYGFLDGNWAAWDIRKVVNGRMYLNNSSTYYIDPDGTSYFNTIIASGNITANSDISLKDNITPIPNALDKVLQIRGVTFNRNDIEDNPRHAGVIAQEVEKVLPEVVSEGEDGIKSVAYGNMVSLLIEAIKEQQEQIDMLKEKLESK